MKLIVKEFCSGGGASKPSIFMWRQSATTFAVLWCKMCLHDGLN